MFQIGQHSTVQPGDEIISLSHFSQMDHLRCAWYQLASCIWHHTPWPPFMGLCQGCN